MKSSENEIQAGIRFRTNPQRGDLEAIAELHQVVYARERGFDSTFATYVAGPLAEFGKSATDRERLWIAEAKDRIVGCIAIVAHSPRTAQVRWFLVDPSCRGNGLGKTLLATAVDFARDHAYSDILLWTESALTAAAHLYRRAGFQRVEEKPGRMWGVDLVEEKYELRLR